MCYNVHFQGHYASGTSPVPGHYSARSFYPHNGNNFPVNSPIMENRPKTAGPFIHEDQLHPSLPSIHHGLYHSTWGDDEDIGSGEGSRHSEERLKWIDALNKWIPEQVTNNSKSLKIITLMKSFRLLGGMIIND